MAFGDFRGSGAKQHSAIGPIQANLRGSHVAQRTPSVTLDGIHGVGSGVILGGTGVVGFLEKNQGTGLLGIGGGIFRKNGGIGVQGDGGSQLAAATPAPI